MQLGNRGVWRAQPLLCLSSSSSSSSSSRGVSLQEESRCCYRRFFCASFWSPKFLSPPPPPPQKSALRRFGRKVIVLRRRASSSSTTKMTSSSRTTQNFQFGDAISISPKHVFYETPLSFAFVNLKPVVPGHVLVCPKRIVEKYEEMTTEEISDAMSVSQKVAVAVKKIHAANAMTLTIQDGPDAGQTVFHVHVHVMPRKPNDFARNDDIYEKLETCEEEERKARVDADDARKARSEEDMEKEATEIRRAMME